MYLCVVQERTGEANRLLTIKNKIMNRLDSLINKYSEMIAELYEFLTAMGIDPETDEHMIELVNQKNYYIQINMLGY